LRTDIETLNNRDDFLQKEKNGLRILESRLRN
jgi:hypothetical protein